MSNFTTKCIHADDILNRVTDVVSPINVSTTFRYDNDNLTASMEVSGLTESEQLPVYSRESHPNADRLETVLTSILGGFAVAYASGLSAYYAVLTHICPKRLFISDCYHGCQLAAKLFAKTSGMQILSFDEIETKCSMGDLVHVEDPSNPYGESSNVVELVKRVHKKRGLILIDSTLAPPPLRNPWDLGVDIILHSGTKYLGGHSDLLSGVVCVDNAEQAVEMRKERMIMGTIPASLESFLLLRSLRTLEVRVRQQSANCLKLVKFLKEHAVEVPGVLASIRHASLQTDDYVKSQNKEGYSPVFSIILKEPAQCPKVIKELHIFQHATSLGGVESLIEWRSLSDSSIDKALLRISVGLENAQDLLADLFGALKHVQGFDL
ncbi:LANO_0C00474g1_1 [Lachancea nothofagi CBS 11611]|uniref:LANO_0C00474g1_1 n=1 Tax=Lachancea nothofagi CBS 11611 TaxID=1266666 RepID=A0A1G4J371_9SACH|nr:LANO_0C00474g1_1 [Lachancea nothofagi CBS 11611]